MLVRRRAPEAVRRPGDRARFNGYYAGFFAVALEKLRPCDHAGVEFVHAIHGIISVRMSAREHVLEAGD